MIKNRFNNFIKKKYFSSPVNVAEVSSEEYIFPFMLIF